MLQVFMCLLDIVLHGEQTCPIEYLVFLNSHTSNVFVCQGIWIFIPMCLYMCIHVPVSYFSIPH